MSERAKAFSLKRRLLATLLGTISLVWLAAAGYSYWDARHEVSELLDAHLAQSAALIAAQTGEDLQEIDLEHAPPLHERSRKVAFQIWEKGALLRVHSVNAPPQRLSERDEGFSDAVIAGRTWRVFSGWDPERRYLVQVGERDEARREIAASIAGNLLIPLLLALPALGLFAWASIARALRLGELREELQRRRPQNLVPLATAGSPVEIEPLVESLNALFARVSALIDNERRFTADAAHELRTPLAALKTQAQVALGAPAEGERRHALEQVVAGCDRAARLVEQLLTLARLEPEQFGGEREACDLRLLARQTIAELAPPALAKHVGIELEEGEPVLVNGYPGLIGILMRNLIDNAVRYGARGNTVQVKMAPRARGAVLSVSDKGPGIPIHERPKVGQRFYRILGSGESGSGLGLSIVNRIAELHGAAMELREGPKGRGLEVRVAFPAAS